MSHHDVIVVGTGLAGLTAAVRLAESGARVLVLAKGVGATHLSGGTVDVLGYDPDRVASPAEALARVRAGASLRARRRGRGRPGARVVQGALRGRAAGAVRLHRRAGREPAAAERGRRAAALGGGPGVAGGRRPARRRRAVRGRLPRPEGLLRPAAGGQRLRARTSASGPVRPSSTSRRRAVPTSTRSGSRAPSTRPRSAPRWPRSSRAPGRGGARRVPRGAGDRLAARRLDASSRTGSGACVFEVPTLPPSVPGMRVYATLRDALRRAGGKQILNAVVIGAEREGGAGDARCAPGSGCAR